VGEKALLEDGVQTVFGLDHFVVDLGVHSESRWVWD
jgi:hypothetical protein